MRRNSGGYFHSEDTLKLKLGLAVSSLEQGKWKSLARISLPYFTSSMPCSNLVSRPPHESFKHNFIDKCLERIGSSNSSSDLHLIPASAQHESTSPVSLLPRASAPTLALGLVSLSNAKLLSIQTFVGTRRSASPSVTPHCNPAAPCAMVILIACRTGPTLYKTHSHEGRLPSNRSI